MKTVTSFAVGLATVAVCVVILALVLQGLGFIVQYLVPAEVYYYDPHKNLWVVRFFWGLIAAVWLILIGVVCVFLAAIGEIRKKLKK